MIEKLKEIFPDLIEAKLEIAMDSEYYDWYSTPDNEIIGIPIDHLTEKEQMLLNTFLSPYYASQPPLTKREDDWINVIFNNGNSADLVKNQKNLSYRYVYFSLSDDKVDPIAFREAIHGLFPYKVPIIWENNHEGILIEDEPIEEVDISYEEMIEVLMSDFYMKVKFYIGPYFNEVDRASEYFKWIKDCYQKVNKYMKGSIMDHISAVPFLFLEPSDDQTSDIIIPSILKDTITEDDLLETIRTFLESNSNATLAAKKLYMHRNSLQYRVDKFIEKTGIDVKQFKGALSVYLTLLLKHKKSLGD
ncbi:PucR family transcriptional regulator [Aquibacillus salsiterrae]|uniref:Helix-turn-helix domain-containing protein n=1 Tax=Aquibacillus salsiterrae TaxID=2950439 RepID=A0A9X3WH16_9BACI|nr:helix-turn-helix domain-containing protein [Aquibacillus salsiterrae]MDC3417289.1 helix-turn-helix domain-containing protein [Aquibacillus salsiterrae]